MDEYIYIPNQQGGWLPLKRTSRYASKTLTERLIGEKENCFVDDKEKVQQREMSSLNINLERYAQYITQMEGFF